MEATVAFKREYKHKGRTRVVVECIQCARDMDLCKHTTLSRKRKGQWSGLCRSCAGKRSAGHPSKKVSQTCAPCGRQFYVFPSRVGKVVTCGRKECQRRRRRRPRPNYRGPSNPNWKGGRYLNTHGYVLISMGALSESDALLFEHGRRRPVLEHRLVMARHLGRPLSKKEIIHHKNGVKSDNRIENLEVMSAAEHCNGIVFGNNKLTCPSCGESAEVNEYLRAEGGRDNDLELNS